MKENSSQDEKIAQMTFASIYPLYIKKIERKGRSVEELNTVITWLTGFNEKEIKTFINENATFQLFFKKAKLHKNSHLIKGRICGSLVEEINNPLTQKVRYLDKLVDELAKGKSLEQILRK